MKSGLILTGILKRLNNKNVYIFNVKNTEKYKLRNIDAADMDIYNNKIYYANKSDGNKIYSICFNGKENIKVRYKIR